MMQSGNPMLNNGYFEERGGVMPANPNAMTLNSTIAKSGLLIGTCTAAAAGTFILTQNNPGLGILLTFGGSIVTLILSLICAFKPQAAPFTAMPVALSQGALAGGMSYFVTRFLPQNEQGEHIVADPQSTIFAALLLTMSIAGGLLTGYATGLIRPGKLFRAAVVAGCLGLCGFGLIAFGMSMFGNSSLISVYDPSNGGTVSILFSLGVTVFASMCLVMDFEQIHNGVRNQAPKYFEWYGAQTLLITLVWLYINVLKLLTKLANRE